MRLALERHIYGELLFIWEGPLVESLAVGEPPETLRRAAADLAPDDLEEWGGELRWLSIELPNLPRGDPLRLFKTLAVNALPVIAYRELRPDRNNISYDEIVAQTGVVSYPLSNELHQALQRDDWVVDRVECSGEEFPHVQEHPDPEKGWYALVSDSRSSTIYFHVPEDRPVHMGTLDLYIGQLVGEEGNGALIEPNPYNRASYSGLRSVTAVTETVGGTGEYEGDHELPWEAVGSFLRTRDRLITRWDYDGFIRRFDPRIAACSFRNVALQREDAFLPGVAITVHFDQELNVPRADCQVAIALLARELERRAALGTQLEVRLGEPRARMAEAL